MSTRKTNRQKALTPIDVYAAYAKRLLLDTNLWGKYEKRMKNYRIFKEVDGRPIEVMSYLRFRKIIETWFSKAQDYIIEGSCLTMGHNIGRIGPRHVERNFKNKKPDWKKSKQLWEKKGERKGLVYHLDDSWVRIGWDKPNKIKNESLYRFRPAEDNPMGTGFKQRFVKANQENPLLKKQYPFYPYIIKQD